ncbi:MAG: cupin domain-containing protein [Gammaproteobacteria bacterium]|nr:cupin domain-containing protein [Gammaproteobacteria bacterium]
MIHRLSTSPATAPEISSPPAERLVAGQPTQRLWSQYVDARNEFFVGVWESEPGSWRVRYTEEEYCRILEGRSRLIAADGTVDDVRAGDEFVIPRGFEGVWEVLERTRKVYVIHERAEPVAADSGAAR